MENKKTLFLTTVCPILYSNLKNGSRLLLDIQYLEHYNLLESILVWELLSIPFCVYEAEPVMPRSVHTDHKEI